MRFGGLHLVIFTLLFSSWAFSSDSLEYLIDERYLIQIDLEPRGQDTRSAKKLRLILKDMAIKPIRKRFGRLEFATFEKIYELSCDNTRLIGIYTDFANPKGRLKVSQEPVEFFFELELRCDYEYPNYIPNLSLSSVMVDCEDIPKAEWQDRSSQQAMRNQAFGSQGKVQKKRKNRWLHREH